ncbi:MAG: MATE family efflux transporter [Oscillospiraceae bacterium]|nr:MATE family efflux transporter [Oscillospiraceae bacterium]MDD7280131.1 MATE family efflux transporter [Oscillospiraceae bacterium]MDY2862915.1 MATE family efflux transporter [Oscillospiraceae bacterium]
MAEQKKYEMDMCSGSILKKMLMFTLPLMLSSILQLLFNAADIVVVGRFAGDNSLAAVGSTTALINLLTNLFVGLSIGANVTAARNYGGKREAALSRTVHTAVTISIISGVILTVIGVVGTREMLRLMSTPDEIIDLAADYLRIYFAGITATTIYNFGSALLRAIGDTKRPLYYLLAAGAVNVVLNLLFVIVFKMDVSGVALATIISESLSAFLVIRCLMRETGAIKLELKKLRVHKAELISIIRIGLPAGFQGIVFALSNVVIQSSVNLFGNIVVAGNSAAANIEGFVYMAMNSFYQATLSFMSQNFGAGEYKRLNKILACGELCVVAVGLVLGNAAVLFGNQLLSIYSDSPEVIAAGMVRLHYISKVYFLCGIMDVLVGALRGIGYSVLPMVVSLLGACGLRLLWIATVFQIPEFHKVEVVYLSYAITWIITAGVHFLCYVIVRKKVTKKYEQGTPANT